jgi:predicted nucleic acid-binding protein
MRVLTVSRPIGRQFARIRGTLRKQGLPIAQPDLLIAAMAIHHNLILATRNVRHYQRIPGLKLLLPTT